MTFWMSWNTAPEGDVTTPMTLGKDGRGRFRDSSNNPSASKRRVNRSNSKANSPTPAAMARSTMKSVVPRGS